MSIPLLLQPSASVAKPPARRRAFTLVETTIAMGIVAFAMVPILGLVPMGLGKFRNAISFTAEAQIVQALSNEILLTDYSVLAAKYAQPVMSYYGEEGESLASGGQDVIYSAKVVLGNVSAPAEATLTPTPSKCALIEISNIAHPSSPKKYSLVIPKG